MAAVRVCVFVMLAVLTAACGASVGSVAGESSAWSPPEFITTIVAGDRYALRSAFLAGNEAGDLVVLWTRRTPWSWSIVATNRLACVRLGPAGWGAVEELSTDAPRGARAAVNARGEVFVTWLEARGGRAFVVARRAAPGAPWSETETLEEVPTTVGEDVPFTHPDVAVDDAGNAEVVWSAFSRIRSQVRSASYIPARGWRAGSPLADTGDSPRVGLDAQGGGVAAWVQATPGTLLGVWARTRIPGGAWSAPALVGGSARYLDFDLHVENDGDAVVGWYGERSWKAGVRLYVAGRGWDRTQEFTVSEPHNMRVVCLRDCAALAVWEHRAGREWNGAYYMPTRGWSAPEKLLMDREGSYKLAARGDTAFLVWSERLEAGGVGRSEMDATDDKWGHGSNLWARTFHLGNGWRTPIALTLPERRDPCAGRAPGNGVVGVAAGRGGSAHAVLLHVECDVVTLWSSRYTPP